MARMATHIDLLSKLDVKSTFGCKNTKHTNVYFYNNTMKSTLAVYDMFNKINYAMQLTRL